jgi:hypothetical protein
LLGRGRILVISVSAAVALLSVTLVSSGQTASRLQGTIATVNGNVLTVVTAEGRKSVTLEPDAVVMIATQVGEDDIKSGEYVAATAQPLVDGRLSATEIRIIPPKLAGRQSDEGFQFVGNTTLTNATVAGIADTTVDGADDKVLTLTYPTGEKLVVVTPQTRITANVPGNRSTLVPGTKVDISAVMSGATYAASSVTVLGPRRS